MILSYDTYLYIDITLSKKRVSILLIFDTIDSILNGICLCSSNLLYYSTWVSFPLSLTRKGGDVVKGKNTKEKKSKEQKLDPIIVVAIINGLFALAIALINALL